MDECSYVEYTEAIGSRGTNWGNKFEQEAKWSRRNKLSSWSPCRDEWEVSGCSVLLPRTNVYLVQIEERARKRLAAALFSRPRSPSPPRLHLRSPTPPLLPPYPLPTTQHLSFTSFVLDPAAQRSFRSEMINDLEKATCTLVEGETQLRRAMGRLWRVLSDNADSRNKAGSNYRQVNITKQEDTDENENLISDQGNNVDTNQILVEPEPFRGVHPLFLDASPLGNGGDNQANAPSSFEQTQREHQEDALEKGLAVLRDLQEDSREFVERLEEIREDLGFVRNQKKSLWTVVRERALREMEGEYL